ncbi:hypothetical protein LCGC14_1568760, partial [marine sediment metagenome]
RLGVQLWGHDPTSWTAGVPTPGTAELDAAGAEVVGRHVFYNNSDFDGNDPAAGESDDAAIAVDKRALLPGETATFANYTSYLLGINGLMVDIVGSADADSLTAADFSFRIGNDNSPNDWTAAPAPLPIAVRKGAGTDGADRITIRFADNAIENKWLEVTVLATAATGLIEPDVFYIGNAIADSGSNALNTIVNASDEIGARNFYHGPMNQAAVDDVYDYNRDKQVNGTDQIIARNNQTNPLTMLRLITAPAVDAAIEQASTEEIPDTDISSAEWNWLHEFDRMNSKDQTTKKDDSREATVDLLLATDWA